MGFVPRSTIGSCAAALALVCGAHASPVQHTIAYQNGHIRTVAQNAHVVGWITLQPSSHCLAVIRLRNLTLHAQVALNAAGGPTCSFETDATDRLAIVDDSQAIWVYREFGNDSYYHVMLGHTGSADTEAELLEWPNAQSDAVGTAGADTTAVYGWYEANLRDDCLGGGPPDPCPVVVYGGGVKTAAGVAIPGAPPAASVAGSNGRVAILVAGTIDGPVTVDDGVVQIRSIATGALIGHFTATAPVVDLALAPHSAAVLVAGRVERFALSGASLDSIPVPRSAAQLSASDSWIVYSDGHLIHAVPAGGGPALTIHTASPPRGLSIWGKRVVWAETYAPNRNRIQSVTLP